MQNILTESIEAYPSKVKMWLIMATNAIVDNLQTISHQMTVFRQEI